MKSKKKTNETNPIYMVDLRKIDGGGAFPCPKCGTVISPDAGEGTWEIVESKVKNDELSELIINCNKCGVIIKLVGFQ